MSLIIKRSREDLVMAIKCLGQEMIDRAEDLVGTDVDEMTDIDIWCSFPVDSMPSLDVSKSYEPKSYVDYLGNKRNPDPGLIDVYRDFVKNNPTINEDYIEFFNWFDKVNKTILICVDDSVCRRNYLHTYSG